MTLYCRHSQYLENYAPGHILVEALDVETARTKARAHFEEHVQKEHFWMFSDYDIPLGEGDLNNLDEYRLEFEADIAADPDICEVVFIHGSE